jgi:single-stranded-DNA-specific exonuclease
MKRWDILNKLGTKNLELKTEEIIKVLLSNRGLRTKRQIDKFLYPKLADITLKSVGIENKAVNKAIGRISTAIKNKEQIIIYGDYDVDGITAAAILWETLYALKAKVTPYIPHRIEEGYGLSIKGIENILKMSRPKDDQPLAENTKLIITVDNGIVANEAVEFANKQSIDVIITDHHTLPKIKPKAYAIIHTSKLCGAGIAYLLAKEIKHFYSRHSGERQRHQNQNELDSGRALPIKSGSLARMTINDNENNLLELAALGTIADLVPLTDANRTIVSFGLKSLRETKRLGLQELYKEAGFDPAQLGVYEVGHIIAPRLNATGRMNTAMDSLRLICTTNHQRAKMLAGLLGATNRKRQDILLETVKHAIDSIKYQIVNSKNKQQINKILIVTHENYPEGIIGLIAGRLVEEFYRPSIVISKGEKYSKGSVRSISGFNIIEFLRQSSEYFINVGGHPMAAGFTIETRKIEKMTKALEKFAHDTLDNDLLIKTLKVDCEMPLTAITNDLYDAIQALNPFGMGNPEPTFVSRNLTIDNLRVMGKDGKHLRLTVKKANTVFNAVAFGMGDHGQKLHIGDTIDLAYTIDKNTWNGTTSLQLKAKDIKI